MSKLCVVIPTWNGSLMLKECLLSLRQQSLRQFELVIVDNGSTDDTVKMVKRIYPQAKLVELGKNTGFAVAVNVGIAHTKAEYIVLVNNDTKLDKRCLEYLVKTADNHPEVGMVAAKMVNFFKSKMIDSAGVWIDEIGHANGVGWQEKDQPKFNLEGEVFLVSGGGCLLSRKMLKQVGVFDEDYFAYFEDVDLGLRAQLQGFKAWYQPKAVIYHVHKATSNRNRNYLEYLQFRNMTMTLIKDFPMEVWLRSWWKIMLVNLHTVWYLARRGYLWPALKAEGYILVHLDQLLIKRRVVQDKMLVTPEYILSWIRRKKFNVFS